MRTILYFRSSDKDPARQKVAGVYAFAHGLNWNIREVEPGATPHKAVELVRFWNPDGIIVECGSGQNLYDPKAFNPVPTVFLDRNPKTFGRPAFSVTHDSIATAEVAARELLSLRLKSYAYVPWPEPRFWSDEREAGFANALQVNGCSYIRFNGKATVSSLAALQGKLAAWLDTLPKPCGIFAANDFLAAQVLAVAMRSGIPVPQDLAVIGVDNDELTCENTKPTLSSIMPDFRLAGEMAADMLNRIMITPSLKPQSMRFGPFRLVRRSSTMRRNPVDHDVLSAMDLIRREACNGLKARDVFALFRCSRRMAEMRFRSATGQSPLDVIQDVRLQKAKDLLRDDSRDRNAIANLCGYSSANALANFLRKHDAARSPQAKASRRISP